MEPYQLDHNCYKSIVHPQQPRIYKLRILLFLVAILSLSVARAQIRVQQDDNTVTFNLDDNPTVFSTVFIPTKLKTKNISVMPTKVGISSMQRHTDFSCLPIKIQFFLNIESLCLGDSDLRRNDGLFLGFSVLFIKSHNNHLFTIFVFTKKTK